MDFQIGDKVIHCTYGLGEVVNIEEKTFQGQPTDCYVVQINDMLLYIPTNDQRQYSLRTPTLPEDFEKLEAILTRPGDTLPEDRVLRKNQLQEQIRDGQLASVCRVIRELTDFKRSNKLSEQEKSILERAIKALLTEWAYAHGIPQMQAQQVLDGLLGE